MNSRNTIKMVEHKLVLFATVRAFWTLVTLLIELSGILLKWKYIQDHNYAILGWSVHMGKFSSRLPRSLDNRIYLLQKRAVRAISKTDYKASSKPLFANLKILDVYSLYSLQVSSFMYLYHNDALPISFTQIFQTGNQIHQYSTRYSDYYRPHTCRTNIKKFSILFQVPRIWNSLPIDIKNAPTFSMFKRMIKPFLRVRQNAT